MIHIFDHPSIPLGTYDIAQCKQKCLKGNGPYAGPEAHYWIKRDQLFIFLQKVDEYTPKYGEMCPSCFGLPQKVKPPAACECGGTKCGYGPGNPGHARWCEMRAA